MIQVNVRTNGTRRTVTVDPNVGTPKSVFAEIGVGTSNAQINLDGTIMTATDLNSTFTALGVADDSSVALNSVVKADGANK